MTTKAPSIERPKSFGSEENLYSQAIEDAFGDIEHRIAPIQRKLERGETLSTDQRNGCVSRKSRRERNPSRVNLRVSIEPPEHRIGVRFDRTCFKTSRAAHSRRCWSQGQQEKRAGYREIPCFFAAFFSCSSAMPKSPFLTNCSNSS